MTGIEAIAEYVDSVLGDSAYGWWDWYIPTNLVVCNDLKLTWLGYDPKEYLNRGYEAFTGLVHPEDYERCMLAMRRHLSGEAPLYRIDYRILAHDGTYRWYLDRGVITERDEQGNPVRLRGIVIDIGSLLVPEKYDEHILEFARKSLPFSPDEDGMFSVCSSCKRIKVSDSSWIEIASATATISRILGSEVSHGICSDCIRVLYPEIADDMKSS